MFRSAVALSAAALTLLVPLAARATYSPPLVRVRIDQNRSNHTPSLVLASEARSDTLTRLTFGALGVQYLGQLEWDFGFGLQVGAAAGRATAEGTIRLGALGEITANATGYFLGGQLRVYQMLWMSQPEDGARASAVTAFVNLRALYYRARDDGRRWPLSLEGGVLTGGLGAMAELSLTDHLSICPYGWITPGLTSSIRYEARDEVLETSAGVTLRRPVLFGVDIWLYLFPPDWDSHLSLSFLTSFVDTEGEGDRLFAGVLGYTF